MNAMTANPNLDFSLVHDDLNRPLWAGTEPMSLAINDVLHNPYLDQLTKVVCAEVKNQDAAWFRTFTLFFLAKIPAAMHVSVNLSTGGMPVNAYVAAFAESGYGKSRARRILDKVIAPFEKRFRQEVFPQVAEDALLKMAIETSNITGRTESEELEDLKSEFRKKGPLPLIFSAGTREGVRQVREKILMADIGAINFLVDEFGQNIEASEQLITLFFELYDTGETDTKITVNSADRQRSEDRQGVSPTNAVFFGTPSKIFDGGATEKSFDMMMLAGYGRRCNMAYGNKHDILTICSQNADDIFDDQAVNVSQHLIDNFSQHFAKLADPAYHNWEITVPRDVEEEYFRYLKACILRAHVMPADEEILKLDMMNRMSKALKIAGIFAFLDERADMSIDHYYQAIKLCEESGDALADMYKREPTYVRLARYIAGKNKELTFPELHEALKFFKTNPTERNTLLSLARDWGSTNHVVIKRYFKAEGVEVVFGETLKKTELDKIGLSYSAHPAYNYEPTIGHFDQLNNLFKVPDLNFCVHAFENNHRSQANAIPGFNLIVLDVDGGIPLTLAQDMLKDITYKIYTTKRHTDQENRYRVVIPTNYILKLNKDDYGEFMTNVLAWMPFPQDPDEQASRDSARKWLTNENCEVFTNIAETFDVLPFLPRTSQNIEFQKTMQPLESLDNLERWFASKITSGSNNRNNQLHNYAQMLSDQGFNFTQVSAALISFNSRLPDPLEESELRRTILVTIAKKMNGKA